MSNPNTITKLQENLAIYRRNLAHLMQRGEELLGAQCGANLPGSARNSVTAVPDRVRLASRYLDRVAGPQHRRVIPQLHGEFALVNLEMLVLQRVEVGRQFATLTSGLPFDRHVEQLRCAVPYRDLFAWV